MKKFKEVKTYQQDHLSFKKGDVVASFYDTNGNFILQTISKTLNMIDVYKCFRFCFRTK